ncbi:hypothetical protein [Pseudomonas atacamensis]|uniref:hypothetical protein n=1 Tax=Pseudomonas atacamensis TaxID=2565368 RepID=UPI0019D24A90|nr:hypothetical protein [Pseudomonas atacamensis]QSL85953.1 hypothetical protein JWU58_17405 [Pseudomonas atacamensis]
MKVNCYPAFDEKGNRTLLAVAEGFKFSDLPQWLQDRNKDIPAQESDINIDDYSCRWWLSKPVADNLRTQGWDASVWVWGPDKR